MDLRVPFAADGWSQTGGFYSSDGVYFFAATHGTSLASVPPTTGLDLAICPSLSLSAGSSLRLSVLSIWNARLPISALKLAVRSRVVSRESAVFFTDFGFSYQGNYLNWIEPQTTLPLSLSHDTASPSSDLLALSSTCHIGSTFDGSQCLGSRLSFFCFSRAQSPSSLPLDASLFTPSAHSVMLLFQVKAVSGTGGAL